MADSSSIFRTFVFTIWDIGPTGKELGVVRAQDPRTGTLYDFHVKNRAMLSLIEKNPQMYRVLVSTNVCDGARVRKFVDSDLPAVGMAPTETIYCEVLDRGVCTPPILHSPVHLMNDSSIGDAIPLVYNQKVVAVQSDKEYDETNIDERNARAAQNAGFSASKKNAVMGVQGSAASFGSRSGMSTSSESMNHATQETNHGGSMFTTAPNFLQHYFIHLAGAVSLPMNHMVNLIKMIAIGKFVKQVVGSKKSKTGIYGLVAEVESAAKK